MRNATDDGSNLPLRERRGDAVLAAVSAMFALGSFVSDIPVTLGAEVSATAPTALGRAMWQYARDVDPGSALRPAWIAIVIGVAAFVYTPFWAALAWALVKGRNAIQLPAVIVATMCATTTALLLSVSLFGEAVYRSPDPVKLLAVNGAYVLVPLVLIARMRRPMPFTRRF